MSPEILLTPPLLARRRMAGLVTPRDQIQHNTLNVISENLSMSLSTSFSKAFSSFSSSSHSMFLMQMKQIDRWRHWSKFSGHVNQYIYQHDYKDHFHF
jgi:hypothetical protein